MATNTPVNERVDVPPPPNIRLSPSHKMDLPHLNLQSPEADTLVYLQLDTSSKPLRCSSQKLLATGSPVFAKLLGPTCQYRLLRRKNLLKLGLPMGIKFVIDLSPPTEGEDAVDAVEKLWCPDEVLAWNSNLDGNYNEEDERPPSPMSLPIIPHAPEIWPSEIAKKLEMQNAVEEAARAARNKKPAYSYTRHTGAVERVLHIIHGLDPQIYTTPMWYTVHKTALQLECTAAVQDHIISWLYVNQGFIERHPTLILQTAAELRNVGLFRDTFAILVGGKALGGRIGDSGVFTIDENASPEAAQWGKGVTAAKKSLQTRLEQLHFYISSTAWLDNAQIIPEYKKITDHLTGAAGSSPYIRQLTEKLDAAIRVYLKARLALLYVFSEDPGNTTWMDPSEKAVFDMIPGRDQVFSKIYWKQLLNFPRNRLALEVSVEMALSEWQMALKAQKEGVLDGPQMAEVKNKALAPVYTERVPDVQPILKIRNPDQEQESSRASSSTQVTVSTHPNPGQSSRKQRWMNLKSSLKIIERSSSSCQSPPSTVSHSEGLSLSPISPSRTSNHPTEIPGISQIAHNTTPPPTYEVGARAIDELPAYTEIASPGTAVEVKVEKVGEKRKSRGFTDPDIEDSEYGSDTDIEEILYKGKGRDYDESMTNFPRAERIEIANPMRKRHCSVERDAGGGSIIDASFCTQLEDDVVGEPEMFNISGVYDEPEPEPKRRVGKGKGKAIEVEKEGEGVGEVFTLDNLALTYSEELSSLYETDPVGSAFDEAMALAERSTKPSNLSSAIAYWRSSNTRIFAAENAVFGPPASWADPESDATTTRLINHDWDSYTVQPSLTPMPPKKQDQEPVIAPFPTGPWNNVELRALWPLQPGEVVETLQNTLPNAFHKTSTYTDPSHLIDMEKLWEECLTYFRAVAMEQLMIPISFEPMTAGEGQVLVSLRNEEWQFCPLWAEGMMDYNEESFGESDPVNITSGRMVDLEVRGERRDAAQKDDENREGSVADSYDDCATEVESIGSFSTGGFSSFGVLSEFDDSESEAETISGDTEREVEMESVPASETGGEVDDSATEAGDSDSDSGGFEEISWDDDI